jgi:hypothetical protein
MKTATSLRRTLLTLITGAAGAVFALAPTLTTAASTQSYQISPPTANYSDDKGGTQHGTIKVTNLTDTPMTVKVGKENFAAKGEEGEIELTDNADPLYSLAPWFSFDAAQLDIPARGTKELHYTVAIPADAEPGGRYGSIVFNTIPPKLPPGQSGAAVQQTLASIVFMRINGAAKEQLSVASFETGHLDAKKNWSPLKGFEYGPVDILTRVKNSGNVHEKPTGTITIKNLFGFKVATIPLDEHFVIPGATRRLHNTWPDAKHKQQFLFGSYTATLNAKYADGKTLTASTTFTVIPWKLVAIVLIVLLVLIVFFWKTRRRFGRAFRILAGKE